VRVFDFFQPLDEIDRIVGVLEFKLHSLFLNGQHLQICARGCAEGGR
jgi:hypothetical protein